VKFDVALLSHKLGDVAAYSGAVEAIGFDGLWLAETKGDPFLPLVLAAEHTASFWGWAVRSAPTSNADSALAGSNRSGNCAR
jgi:hypothetical protein